ncbi:kinase-like protein [Massarina eburnea CBS 473.64]|uniref:Kinase-like protein n=1 Tax=Massarina eburnea CBS 473.64 TaxID=1395130 RepID=A0A6A6RYT5_9PLEO|nr:kinase-like protein [Massarina eburnea CBS 473.64]
MDFNNWIGDGREYMQHARHVQNLGEGTDGIVAKYRHERGHALAVKIPTKSRGAIDGLWTEITNLHLLTRAGRHENIVKHLGWDENWQPGIPALFIELAAYGDLEHYSRILFSKTNRMPELTVWKIIHDLSSALHYIHNQLPDGNHYCHSDMKPGNILVCHPRGMKKSESGLFPLAPVFKISDFGRMTKFDPDKVKSFQGTVEYAPPMPERAITTPACDIWAIAASISYAVFRTHPIENRKDFIARYNTDWRINPHRKVLKLDEPLTYEHRALRAIQKRDLNVEQDQQNAQGIPHELCVVPYSDNLQFWYSMCYEHPQNRITAETLNDLLLPTAEKNIIHWAREFEREKRAIRAQTIDTNEWRISKGFEPGGVPLWVDGVTTDRGQPGH